MEFSYLNPTQINFGKGKIASIAQSIPSDQKVLVYMAAAPLNTTVFINKSAKP